MPNNTKLKIKLLVAILLAFTGAFIYFIVPQYIKEDELSYSEAISYIKEDEVSEITIYPDELLAKLELKDDSSKKTIIPSVDEFSTFVLNEIENGANIELMVKETSKSNITSSLLLKIAMYMLMFAFLKRMLDGTMNPKKEIKPVESKVKFSDVAGIDEEKAQLEEVVRFLKNPEKYRTKGARIPKGVLLNGAPGTGKTLLAKAIAGEAGVPFFQVNGSSFEEKYIGVGASRVRDLFKKAKEMAPCIIFIDEIDSIARSRYNENAHNEQSLNQLLAEMDGFDTKDNVIVIAATNHLKVLDEAIVRPGRFDRHVYIPMPDANAREKILEVHARNKYLAENISLAEIARRTVGFSGADLENVLNEAAIYAVNFADGIITKDMIDESIARVIVGLEKKNVAITPEERKRTAVHEAGHAIVSAVVRPDVKNLGISIVPRGGAGGYNLFDEGDKMCRCKKEMLKQIQVLYGGRVAESLVLDDISTGASNDLERASSIAYSMIARYAMDETLLTPIPREVEFNSRITSNNMKRAEEVCNENYNKTLEILEHYKAQLIKLADLLMEKEYLSQEEVEKFIHENIIPKDFN